MEKESAFSDFFQKLTSDPGKYFLQCEQEELNKILPQFYGYYLVQLGVFDHYNLKSASTINHHVYVGKSCNSPDFAGIQVESNLAELPFQSECVDVVFLPHTLEFSPDPTKLLNEIYNILIPGGKLILLGFNPFSYIGLTKLLNSGKKLPCNGDLLSVGQLKSKLKSIGFSVEIFDYFCFGLPSKKKDYPKHRAIFEGFAKRFFPILGSVYILMAEKKIIPLSPLKLKVFKKKIPVARGFPEPSTNKGL